MLLYTQLTNDIASGTWMRPASGYPDTTLCTYHSKMQQLIILTIRHGRDILFYLINDYDEKNDRRVCLT